MTITNYNQLNNNFIGEIENFTEGEFFQLFYLFSEVNDVNSGDARLIKSYILKDGKCQIIGLITNRAYYLYAKNWDKNQLEKISKISNLKGCPNNFLFLGSENFIKELFELDKFNLEIIKNRSFYKIEKQYFIEFKNGSQILKAKIDNTIEITHLYQQYYIEEYDGKSNKEFNKTKENVLRLIQTDNIWISKDNSIITGFCTSMHKGAELMIGTVFVDTKYRNNGVGKSMVSYVTKQLLEAAEVTYLMTTKENIESNRMVQKLGYIKIYDHTNGIITVDSTTSESSRN